MYKKILNWYQILQILFLNLKSLKETLLSILQRLRNVLKRIWQLFNFHLIRIHKIPKQPINFLYDFDQKIDLLSCSKINFIYEIITLRV